MALSKTFYMADLHEYYPTKKLYPNDNSRTSSFEEGRIDVGDQDDNSWFKLPVDSSLQLSTDFYRNLVVYSPVDSILHLSTGFYKKSGNYRPVNSTLHMSTSLLCIRIFSTIPTPKNNHVHSLLHYRIENWGVVRTLVCRYVLNYL